MTSNMIEQRTCLRHPVIASPHFFFSFFLLDKAKPPVISLNLSVGRNKTKEVRAIFAVLSYLFIFLFPCIINNTMVFHRIIGALGTVPKGGMYAGLERFVGNKTDTYGRDYEWPILVERFQQCKLIFLGEFHSVPAITDFQCRVIQALTPDDNESRQLHVVMEHFSFDMQSLLDEFRRGNITFAELIAQYKAIGSEGHHLEPYQSMLEHIRSHPNKVRLHAGFIPKQYARQLMKEGEEAALIAGKSHSWLPVNLTNLEGSIFHYNYFESLLTGRNLHLPKGPSDRFQGIFQAQLLKDVAMAHHVQEILENQPDDDQIVVIAGNGHVEYYQGVPERVLAARPDLVDRTCLVTCHGVESKAMLQQDSASKLMELLHLGNHPGANPADYVYLYEDDVDKWMEEMIMTQEGHQPQQQDDQHQVPESSSTPPSHLCLLENAKEETRAAYDQVGATAHLKGNLARAHAIMTYLGYTEEEIKTAGPDAYNYQGVGNPHRHANIQPGETVLDIGSGLGVDSFIAAHKTGPNGRLIGIDISAKEVAHAQRRADERGLDIRFATADMERLPLPDNSFDVVISNGAFCLAPNKEAAFKEIHRVLKPGGRMVVCTSTIQNEALDKEVEWPICMRMFIEKNLIKPMCETIGFVNVAVDDSDSLMVFELELPEEATSLNPERYRVHGDSPEFAHLEKFNMDQLCARVCVVAKKPDETTPTV